MDGCSSVLLMPFVLVFAIVTIAVFLRSSRVDKSLRHLRSEVARMRKELDEVTKGLDKIRPVADVGIKGASAADLGPAEETAAPEPEIPGSEKAFELDESPHTGATVSDLSSGVQAHLRIGPEKAVSDLPKPYQTSTGEVSPSLDQESAVGQADGAGETPAAVSGAMVAEPPPASPLQPPRAARIDWEKFTGARLFAWIGGLALFLGISFLVKYSIDYGWISPMVRVAAGLFSGTGVIVAGLRLVKKYTYAAHALCASGPAILFATLYASYDLYHLIGVTTAFLLMALVTATAFLLAVRIDSRYIALLGLLGGFLTPILVSTGEDNPAGLFGYILLLDLGLVFVAFKRNWPFLILLSAAATFITEIAWLQNFFQAAKAPVAVATFLLFSSLYTGVETWAHRRGRSNPYTELASAGMGLLALCTLGGYLLTFPSVAERPALLFLYLFLLNLLNLFLSYLSQRFVPAQILTGSVTFFWMLGWTFSYVSAANLTWALAGYLVFAILHAAFPWVVRRGRPISYGMAYWANTFPLLMLVPILVITVSQASVPWLVWPFLFLICLVAFVATYMLGIVWIGAGVLVLALGTTWMGFRHLRGQEGPGEVLTVLALLSIGFFVAFLVLERKRGSLLAPEAGNGQTGSMAGLNSTLALLRLPALSALLPFLLLASAIAQLEMQNPAPFFGLGLLLTGLLLGLVYFLKADAVSPATLGAVLLVEYTWHINRFDSDFAFHSLPWYLLFTGVFILFPFLLQESMQDRLLPWISAGVSGPLHFFLFYDVTVQTVGRESIGLLPLLFSLLYLPLLIRLIRVFPPDLMIRRTVVAVFGAVTLFFLSLVFPLQFDKEWLTLGWALEGAALVWLFHRVPHPGLKKWGLGLLLVSFVRLALNPAVLDYHAVEQVPIFNWFLYTYGVTTICLVLAAYLWSPRQERILHIPTRPLLYSLASILLFLLMNIEIADYYGSGTLLTFAFGASFAQDLTYSLSWALFGLIFLLVGIRIRSRGTRLACLVLIAVTTFKLFLYDLWSLGQLYRVAAFVGLAFVLILVSALYQRLISKDDDSPETGASR